MELFPDTKWTVLAEATLNGSEDGKNYLGQFCEKYKGPIDKVIRSKVLDQNRVEDLRQEFFIHLIEGKFFRKASRERGKFRAFLLGALQNFLVDDYRKQSAEKRGGGNAHEELDENMASSEVDSSKFDLSWAETLYENALNKVKEDILKKRGADAWDTLKNFISMGTGDQDYQKLARVLDVGLSGAKVEVSRMRKKFRDQLRAEVEVTVDAPHEIDEELKYLKETMIKVWELKNV